MKLQGLRVLDLSRFLPGPWVGQTMADHGAEVILVESHEGEPTRRIGTPLQGFTSYFRNTQRGKLSLVLDLKQAQGQEILRQLARGADVLIESFRPGVMQRLGLGWEALQAINPRLVYCALSAFGQSGAMAQRPSHDLGAQAMTGVLSLQPPERSPALPTLPTADVAGGCTALIGILMALLRRQTTGRGDFIDVSMTDALFAWTPHILDPVLAEGRAPEVARERLYGGAAFYDIYATRDGRHLVLCGAELPFVEKLLTALQRPDLIACCRQPPGEAQAPVKDFLRQTFATRTLQEWDRTLSELGVCHAPVLQLHEAWQLPLLRERGMVQRGADGVEHLGTPIHFREEPGRADAPPPGHGEHGEQILQQLGFDAEARRALREAGVTGGGEH